MIPGLTTRISEETVASAATIRPKSDMIHLTGSTAIATIDPPYAGFSGILIIHPTDGTVATVTTGNIAVAVNMAVDRATVLVYSKKNTTWYPGAIS